MQACGPRFFAPAGLFAPVWLVLLTGLVAAEETAARRSNDRPVPFAVEEPQHVDLGDGPFQAAVAANVKYLLANSELDDMLWIYRSLAGNPKPPGRKVGWENSFPAHAAQFLMGAGNTLRWQEQAELRRRLDRLIEGIKACRAKDGSLLVPGVGAKLQNQWGYSMQMFAHGMVAAGRAGNRDAYPLLAAAQRAYRGLLSAGPPGFPLTDQLNYQGHVASLLAYFSPLGTREDLSAAERSFVSRPWMEALAACRPEAIWKTCPKWPHCYEIIAFEAYLDHYRATGQRPYLDAMLGAWDLIHHNWEHVGGSIAICEGPDYPPKCYPLTGNAPYGRALRQRVLGPFQPPPAPALCARSATSIEIEKSIYNVGLAGQDPQGQGIHYHLILQGRKIEGGACAMGPVPSQRHTCCEGMGTWLYGNLPEYVFSCSPQCLSVNLFHSATATWREGESTLHVAMTTRFPEDGGVQLRFAVARPTCLVLSAAHSCAGVRPMCRWRSTAARRSPAGRARLRSSTGPGPMATAYRFACRWGCGRIVTKARTRFRVRRGMPSSTARCCWPAWGRWCRECPAFRTTRRGRPIGSSPIRPIPSVFASRALRRTTLRPFGDWATTSRSPVAR